MFKAFRIWVSGIVIGVGAMIPVSAPDAATGSALKHGEYVFRIAGCRTCHTTAADRKNNVFLAGGRSLKTPFGTYYSPNITPDPDFGIGKWSRQDFIRALRQGKNPDGDNYFPVFPYVSYTRMSDQDMSDLWAFLQTLPPVARQNKDHEAGLIFGSRFMVGPWKLINFQPGPLAPIPNQSEIWNRGRYLVDALGHCGECHTPRDKLGGIRTGMYLAGTPDGPGGDTVPNITPDEKTGIGAWSIDDYDSLLSMGMLPDGDFVGGSMGEVIKNTESLTDIDRKAIATFLKTVPAVSHKISKNVQKK